MGSISSTGKHDVDNEGNTLPGIGSRAELTDQASTAHSAVRVMFTWAALSADLQETKHMYSVHMYSRD